MYHPPRSGVDAGGGGGAELSGCIKLGFKKLELVFSATNYWSLLLHVSPYICPDHRVAGEL